MRSFVISVIIILICFCISALNALWTCNRTEALVQKVPSLSAENMDEFIKDWQNAAKLLSFTSRRTFIRDIEDALQRLECALEADDGYESAAARKALIYKMKEICRSQCFDLKSIL